MKNLASILLVFPFFGFAQSIDVFVQNTAIEFSGGTYDLNAASSAADLDVVINNNTGTDQSWNLERISPATNFWSESTLVWQNGGNEFEGAGYQNSQLVSPVFNTMFDLNISDNSAAYLGLHWSNDNSGCDLYKYYILHNGVRVDSFNINLCKTIGLDEIEMEDVSIFPNPSSSALNVMFEETVPEKVSVVDLLGNEIANVEAFDSMKIETTGLSNGVYFLSWIDDGIVRRKKFQVQHSN